MPADIVIGGRIFTLFDIWYCLGTLIFIISLLYYTRSHPVLRVNADVLATFAFFMSLHSFSRPAWIMIEDHLRGSYSLYTHTIADAYNHADNSDRWYFCTLGLAAFLAVIVRRRSTAMTNLLYASDVMLLCICLLMSFMRLGCIFSDHGCYGSPTTLPWGMISHHNGTGAMPLHPIPAYDMLLNASVFIFLSIKRWYRYRPGWSSLTVLTASSIHNIYTGPLRGLAIAYVWPGITMTQVLYTLVLCCCVFLYYGLRKREVEVK